MTRPSRWIAMLLCAATSAAGAFDYSGTKTLLAITGDGQRTPIGTITFTPASGDTRQFSIRWRHEAFTDHFLSMREFKCLPGGPEISCQVPYPYAQPGTVAPGQLAWLEHSLLFLHKSPAEFGAKLWNGLYFALREQGNTLVGTPQAVDLNAIGAPPTRLDVPPFGPAQRHEVPAGARWLRQLVIE
ncbi:hypothetical protein KAK06_02995 [Ideonella sp. 4Y11]|uniref:Uncharacterized protein n=1 Tax=Ideonella aquatica TaxID=2824119 RepID=A0A940YFR8_9BURK|nr:hypothetical protein [Ideonella aquatica]MBQ0957917.1 hypothetical protein [Ideonella aquatica]